MLFDLRSAGRRRTVKLVYLGLALLMFVGFVGFSIGSSGLSGGIVDAITGNSGGGNGSDVAVKRQQTQINAAARRTRTSPSEPAAWAALARARLQMASLGDNFDPAKSDYTAAGKRELASAGQAWDKYVALNPKKPDEGLARQMIQAFTSLNQLSKAVSAQELVTEVDGTQQTFTNPQGRPRGQQGRQPRAQGQAAQGPQAAARLDQVPGPVAADPEGPADADGHHRLS
jgi:hypothetical protein